MIQPVFLLSNLQYIQSDDDSWEGLAIFGYKLKYENNFLKTPSFIFGEWSNWCFFCQFSYIVKVTLIHKEDLVKFGYKLDMKVISKIYPSLFLANNPTSVSFVNLVIYIAKVMMIHRKI